MKRILVVLISLLLVTAEGIFAQDTWTQKASLSNTPVNDYTYGCSIGSKAYIIPGFTPGSYFETAPKTDFFEYDPATDTWTKKANLPSFNVSYSLAFSINGKGYVVFYPDLNEQPSGKQFMYRYTPKTCVTPIDTTIIVNGGPAEIQ